jgi:cellulose biosynthesis protein BcsQ
MTIMRTPPDRRVITFYSYKGGVGRTMAVANVAYRLANTHGLRVIAVDWDLEAPGLHRFFGVSRDVAEKTSGILDYFLAWRDAVKREDPEPPPEVSDVTSWILPITDEAHAPHYGAVSVLLAGRQDRGYDARLARLDWRDFYADGAGAAAVEALRAQLIERADVVLIDSRTGLTDAGGICTLQIPDGVILMTAPNEQSLEGIESIARLVAAASKEERAGRARARIWLTIARTPSTEETDLAARWYKEHQAWFQKGIDDGLWLKEDHPEGIRSLEIRHSGRWGFGESVLRAELGVEERDPLAQDHARLTETLLRWVKGEPAPVDLLREVKGAAAKEGQKDLAALEEDARQAQERGDMLGLGVASVELAFALAGGGRRAQAIRKLEQAIGLFLSRGAHQHRARALGRLGLLLYEEGRLEESAEVLELGAPLAREQGLPRWAAGMVIVLAAIRVERRSYEAAVRLYEQLTELVGADPELESPVLWRYQGEAYHGAGDKERGLSLLRRAVDDARQAADGVGEMDAIRTILRVAADDVADIEALKARLTDLEARGTRKG